MLHIMVGYMGFGKTTLANKLAKKYNAVILNNDEIMHQLLGANPEHTVFMQFKPKITDLIWKIAKKIVITNNDVVIDMGAWSVDDRRDIVKKANEMNVEVVFHNIECSLEVAKQRVLKRTKEDKNALYIDENCFNMLLKKFEPITNDENLIVENHKGE